MKKITILMALCLPAITFADDSFYTANPANAQSGIIIEPLSKINPPKEILSLIKEQKTKGYSEKNSSDALEMLKANKRGYANEINNTSDPTDTHMKSDLSKIKLAFDFKPASFIHPFGYAVGGEYINNAGWTAISTFFNEDNIGACRYKLNNMKIANGAVRIPQEIVRYDINKKVTTVFVEGNVKFGFIYNVTWNDSTYNHFLECANMHYDKNITNRMIDLAKKIDKTVK